MPLREFVKKVKFDTIIIASPNTPKLDYISNELRENYGDCFVEHVMDYAPDIPSYPTILFENFKLAVDDIVKKLKSAVNYTYYSERDEVVALITCKPDTKLAHIGLLVDIIVQDDICENIYCIEDRNIPINPDVPPNMSLTKYGAIIKDGIRTKDVQYKIDYDYDPMGTIDDLAVYLSNIYHKYISVITAVQGLSSTQTIGLLRSAVINQYQWEKDVSYNSINEDLTRDEAFRRFFRDCCVSSPNNEITVECLLDALSDYCNTLIPPIKIDKTVKTASRFVDLLELEIGVSDILPPKELVRRHIVIKNIAIDFNKPDETVIHVIDAEDEEE